MFSEIAIITTEFIGFLYNLFYLINDEKYNDLKRMFGWTNINFVLFFIILMIFLLLLEPIFKITKFFCWIISLIICYYLIYLVW
jgi:hypothetical protein